MSSSAPVHASSPSASAPAPSGPPSKGIDVGSPDAAALERMLRRTLVHDARAAASRFGHLSVRELVAEAIRTAWRDDGSRPASVDRASWMRRRALELLESALEREAIAVLAERVPLVDAATLRARDVLTDAGERERWYAFLPETRRRDDAALRDVERALLRLPELRRRVVSHRVLDGLATDEVAWLLDLTADEVERETALGVRGLRLELA